MGNYKRYDLLSLSSKLLPAFVEEQRPLIKGNMRCTMRVNEVLDWVSGGLHAVSISREGSCVQ